MSTFQQSNPTNSRLARACALIGATAILPLCSAFANDSDHAKVNMSFAEFSQGKSDQLQWRVVDDGVMGGLSKGRVSSLDSGVIRFEGTLSLENNGGFSSIRTARMKPRDWSKMEGLVMRVKGDGRTYQLRLESDARYRGSWPVSFKSDFATKKGEWIEVQVPFSSFKGGWRGRDLSNKKLNPAKIERVGLILADKNPGSFKLEVDWIRAFAGSDNK